MFAQTRFTSLLLAHASTIHEIHFFYFIFIFHSLHRPAPDIRQPLWHNHLSTKSHPKYSLSSSSPSRGADEPFARSVSFHQPPTDNPVRHLLLLSVYRVNNLLSLTPKLPECSFPFFSFSFFYFFISLYIPLSSFLLFFYFFFFCYFIFILLLLSLYIFFISLLLLLLLCSFLFYFFQSWHRLVLCVYILPKHHSPLRARDWH